MLIIIISAEYFIVALSPHWKCVACTVKFPCIPPLAIIVQHVIAPSEPMFEWKISFVGNDKEFHHFIFNAFAIIFSS